MVDLLCEFHEAQRLPLVGNRTHAAQGEEVLPHFETARDLLGRLGLQEGLPGQDIARLLGLVHPQKDLAVGLYEIHVGDVVVLPDLVKKRLCRGQERVLVPRGKRREERVHLVEAGVGPGKPLGIAVQDGFEEMAVLPGLILQPFLHLVFLVLVGKQAEDGDTGEAEADDGEYYTSFDGPRGKHQGSS